MVELSPALFLDRDGVIHREVGYLSKPEEVEFLPGIFELCRSAKAMDFKLIIITNQSGIARGLYSEEQFHTLMRWMIEQFTKAHITIDGYYFCPHHPVHGIGGYRKDCSSRKPQPGMILQAANEHSIDLQRSLLIGDRCSDIQAGAAAGIGKIFLLEGTEAGPCRLAVRYTNVSTLGQVSPFLVRTGAF